ncbi:MAG: TraR/DksA C4-type zinc finger protein [Mahellales bacterium]|jgi:YteA family regulatory protein
MDGNMVQHYKKKLLKERKRIENTLNLMTQSNFNSSLRESVEELSSYDNHPADLGSETFEMEKSYALRSSQKFILRQIEDALMKIEKNIYGICDICKKPIDPKRLEALPYAGLCIQCERTKKLHNEGLGHDRPVEEETLIYPFGRSFMDEEDQTMFDGEDAWQSVARYGTAESPQDISNNRVKGYGDMYSDGTDGDGYPGSVEDVEKVTQEQYEEQIPEGHVETIREGKDIHNWIRTEDIDKDESEE